MRMDLTKEQVTRPPSAYTVVSLKPMRPFIDPDRQPAHRPGQVHMGWTWKDYGGGVPYPSQLPHQDRRERKFGILTTT